MITDNLQAGRVLVVVSGLPRTRCSALACRGPGTPEWPRTRRRGLWRSRTWRRGAGHLAAGWHTCPNRPGTTSARAAGYAEWPDGSCLRLDAAEPIDRLVAVIIELMPQTRADTP